MAWRALLRRNPRRSMTLVGDLDQRAGHRRPTSWQQLLGRAAAEHVRIEALTINYRTPATVMEAATAVLRAAGGTQATPARSARDVPEALRVTAAHDELTTSARDVLGAELRQRNAGRFAVIAASHRLAELRSTIHDTLGETLLTRGNDPLSAQTVVLDPAAAKGLEFDVVVLVEPAELLASGPGDLYVAMTRVTQRLHVVHQQPLPAGFPAAPPQPHRDRS